MEIRRNIWDKKHVSFRRPKRTEEDNALLAVYISILDFTSKITLYAFTIIYVKTFL